MSVITKKNKTLKNHHYSHGELIAIRDDFLKMIKNNDLKGISDNSSDPFWKSWRSINGDNNILYYAISAGQNIEVVKILLDIGVDPNHINELGYNIYQSFGGKHIDYFKKLVDVFLSRSLIDSESAEGLKTLSLKYYCDLDFYIKLSELFPSRVNAVKHASVISSMRSFYDEPPGFKRHKNKANYKIVSDADAIDIVKKFLYINKDYAFSFDEKLEIIKSSLKKFNHHYVRDFPMTKAFLINFKDIWPHLNKDHDKFIEMFDLFTYNKHLSESLSNLIISENISINKEFFDNFVLRASSDQGVSSNQNININVNINVILNSSLLNKSVSAKLDNLETINNAITHQAMIDISSQALLNSENKNYKKNKIM